MKRGFILFTLVSFFFLNAGAWAELEKAAYDPFTSQMAYEPDDSLSKKIASEFLSYPFEIIRWPLNKTLVFLEENKIPAKTRYVLEKMEDQGVAPKLSFKSLGAEFDLPYLLHVSDQLPRNLEAKSWVTYASGKIFETGATAGLRPEGLSGSQTFTTFKYNQRPEQDFFGIGPDTSRGDETSYQMDTTALEAAAGYRYKNDFSLNAKAGYRNIDISASEDEPFFRDFSYRRNPASGIHGDSLLDLGLDASWAPEATETRITVPGKVRLGAEYTEGGRGSDARYFRWLTELMKNFKLGSERRIFSMRFYGEQTTPAGNGKVPFHQMPKLGGFAPYYSLSQTLRAYETNRFTAESAALLNLEYRYRIYEYRQWTLAHVLFLDEGQVFQNFGRFQLKDFRESYGTGFRLNYLHHTILNFEVAHGDEGTTVHVINRQPF